MGNNLYNIIKMPWVTEKSNDLMMNNNCVTLKVNMSVNKNEIKNAVEKIFNVSVIKVRTLNVKGKKRRVGRNTGKTSDWKKAIVTLKEGDKIEVTEGV